MSDIKKLKEEMGCGPAYYKFDIPENCKFPQVIFEGAKNIDEVRKFLSGEFIVENPINAQATRYLCVDEIADIRNKYAELLENDQPELEKALAAIEERCKSEVRDAKDRLQAVNTQIKDLVSEVRKGTTDMKLASDTTIKMALQGHWLYYSWLDDKFMLCKVERIPDWNEQDLFANEETNKEAFRKVLGYEFEDEQTATSEGTAE